MLISNHDQRYRIVYLRSKYNRDINNKYTDAAYEQ